jgi:hypothetical protein
MTFSKLYQVKKITAATTKAFTSIAKNVIIFFEVNPE